VLEVVLLQPPRASCPRMSTSRGSTRCSHIPAAPRRWGTGAARRAPFCTGWKLALTLLSWRWRRRWPRSFAVCPLSV